MNRLLSCVCLAVLLSGCKKKSQDFVPVVRPVLGAEMVITGARFDEDKHNMLRIEGHWRGEISLKDYAVRGAVSPRPEGPGSSDWNWFVNMPKSENHPEARFMLEVQCPPAVGETLYGTISFANLRNDGRVTEVVKFPIPNPAIRPAKGYLAETLPVTHTDRGLAMTLESLVTGLNHAPPDRLPSWHGEAVFRMEEAGRPTDGWRATGFWVEPNVGFRMRSGYALNPPAGGRLKLTTPGTFWKEAGPYRLKVALAKVADIPETDRYTLEKIQIPRAGESTAIERVWEADGVKVTFETLYGRGAVLPQGLYSEKAPGTMLVFSVETPADVWISLQEITVNGKTIPQEELRRPDEKSGKALIVVPLTTEGAEADFHFGIVRETREFTFTADATESAKE